MMLLFFHNNLFFSFFMEDIGLVLGVGSLYVVCTGDICWVWDFTVHVW